MEEPVLSDEFKTMSRAVEGLSADEVVRAARARAASGRRLLPRDLPRRRTDARRPRRLDGDLLSPRHGRGLRLASRRCGGDLALLRRRAARDHRVRRRARRLRRTISGPTSPGASARNSWCRPAGGRRRQASAPGRSSAAPSRRASPSRGSRWRRPAGSRRPAPPREPRRERPRPRARAREPAHQRLAVVRLPGL